MNRFDDLARRYNERASGGTTLDSFVITVLLRTIQTSVSRMHDKYLHTNCLAALANMSSQFQHLPAHVAHRLVSLFNVLTRKHSKLLDILQQYSNKETLKAMRDTPSIDTRSESAPSSIEDLAIVEDVMRTVLEIINSCLIHRLHINTNLIYALLYNRDLFDGYRTHPSFQDILQNIETVRSCLLIPV
jgi:dymeclin